MCENNEKQHTEVKESSFAGAANRWSWIPLLGLIFFFVFTPLALLQLGKGRSGFYLIQRAFVKVIFLSVLPIILLIYWAGLPEIYYPDIIFGKHGKYKFQIKKETHETLFGIETIYDFEIHFYRFNELFKKNIYYSNGKEKSYEEFSNGKRNGTCTYWYRNGQKSHEAEFKNDKENGKSTYWCESGKIRSKETLVMNKRYGTCIYYYENGNKRHEAEFKDDKENGESIYWYKSGKIKLKETLVMNKRHGKCTWFSEDGNIEKEMNYSDGISQYQIDEAKKAGVPVTIEEDLGNGVKIKLIYIPAGEFMMGSDAGEVDEKPVHKVKISKGFYIGETEVTQAQWTVIMDNNLSEFEGDNNPVEMVSWDDCQEFIKNLNYKTKGKFRLPTEAEWEYSCRAGTTTYYGFGNYFDDVDEYAWYYGNSGGSTHSVGKKKANNWGLYDIYGNIWEWCSDWYGNYSSEEQTDPQGSKEGTYRVFRGGGCIVFNLDFNLRSVGREYDITTNHRCENIGFRVVKEINHTKKDDSEKQPETEKSPESEPPPTVAPE